MLAAIMSIKKHFDHGEEQDARSSAWHVLKYAFCCDPLRASKKVQDQHTSELQSCLHSHHYIYRTASAKVCVMFVYWHSIPKLTRITKTSEIQNNPTTKLQRPNIKLQDTFGSLKMR